MRLVLEIHAFSFRNFERLQKRLRGKYSLLRESFCDKLFAGAFLRDRRCSKHEKQDFLNLASFIVLTIEKCLLCSSHIKASQLIRHSGQSTVPMAATAAATNSQW